MILLINPKCSLGGTSHQLREKAATLVLTQSRSEVHYRVSQQTKTWEDISKYT
jgi:hypothetical protein